MKITRKQIIPLILVFGLLIALPLSVFLTKKRQDIRPRALQGRANLLLSADSTTSNVGKDIKVLVSLQLTDDKLKVSGVDFLLLYDKDRLDVYDILPNILELYPKAPFTDKLMVSSGGIFDDTFNYIRVVEVARRQDAGLPKGTITLAKITFRAKGEGQAVIKFPDDDAYNQIVGTGLPSLIISGNTDRIGSIKK